MERDSLANQKNGIDGTARHSDPGMVQDYETRKMLKSAEKGIRKNNTTTYISFVLEFVVIVILIAVWASMP